MIPKVDNVLELSKFPENLETTLLAFGDNHSWISGPGFY